jgi:hypothetical protein
MKDLRSIDDPVGPVALGDRTDAGEIGTSGGFRHRDGGNNFATAEFRQPVLLLRLGREFNEVGGNDVGVDAEG